METAFRFHQIRFVAEEVAPAQRRCPLPAAAERRGARPTSHGHDRGLLAKPVGASAGRTGKKCGGAGRGRWRWVASQGWGLGAASSAPHARRRRPSIAGARPYIYARAETSEGHRAAALQRRGGCCCAVKVSLSLGMCPDQSRSWAASGRRSCVVVQHPMGLALEETA